MELFKGNRDRYFVKTESSKEKKALFKIIPKRDRNAVYFHPNSKTVEQFALSVQEADAVNESGLIQP